MLYKEIQNVRKAKLIVDYLCPTNSLKTAPYYNSKMEHINRLEEICSLSFGTPPIRMMRGQNYTQQHASEET